jgi:hypothetical protein
MAIDITLNLDDAQEQAASWKTDEFNAIKLRDDPAWKPIAVDQFVRIRAAELARSWRVEQIDDDARKAADAQKKAEGLV